MSEFEKCEMKFLALSGKIEADTNNGNTEPRIPFGSFDVTGGFDETGLQIRLHGKKWNSEIIKLDWTLLELNHVPMKYVSKCGTKNCNNEIFEFNYLVISMEDVNMSKTAMWRTPKLILYGVGGECFSPHIFRTWTLSAILEKNGQSQRIIGIGSIKRDPNWISNNGCSVN